MAAEVRLIASLVPLDPTRVIKAAEESVVKARRVRDIAASDSSRAAREEPKDIIVNGDSLIVVRSNSWTAELLHEHSQKRAES